MKKIIAAFSAIALTLTFASTAHAEPEQSIVIIDTGIDTKKYPSVKNNIVYEICSNSGNTCPNGKSWHEGIGAAEINTLTPLGTTSPNIDVHGTAMALSAISVNPNIKIIAVRILVPRNNGSMSNMSVTEFGSVTKPVFDWIYSNQQKYNIRSVSFSVNPVTDSWCSGNNTGKVSFETSVRSLLSMNVVTFASTGNGSNKSSVKFPACLPDVMSVGAANSFSSNDGWKISPMSNAANFVVDFYVVGAILGITHLRSVNGKIAEGTPGHTSPAAAVISSFWAKNYKGSFQSTYDYMKSISKPTKNAYVSTTSFVDVLN